MHAVFILSTLSLQKVSGIDFTIFYGILKDPTNPQFVLHNIKLDSAQTLFSSVYQSPLCACVISIHENLCYISGSGVSTGFVFLTSDFSVLRVAYYTHLRKHSIVAHLVCHDTAY